MFLKSKPTYDWMVVGLGNPGLQYENTRHNAGFMAVDLLAKEEKFDFSKHKFKSVCGEFKLKDMRILVLKPETFMNNSGSAVIEAKNFYKIPEDHIIIIFDDMMLDVGKLRIRRKGSHGGHNGIKSIIAHTGTTVFKRIKVGVGEKPKGQDLVNYVLGHFSKGEMEQIQSGIEMAAKSIAVMVEDGIQKAMNDFNGKNKGAMIY